MWRPRDREHSIGEYDPERGMPDFDRYSGRDYERDWDRERYARDRWDRGYRDDYDRGESDRER